MSIEQGRSIADLVPTNPTIQDPVHDGPNHFWLIKNVLKTQFPGKGGLGFASPIEANEDELNYVKGVRKSIQDQIDSLASGQSDSAFEAGTTIIFAQAQAPTGWAQITNPLMDNRMLRVVVSQGGGVGGNDDPTINNVLPAHKHGFATGPGGGHSHTINVSNSGASHTHPIGISAADTNHTHAFQTDTVNIDHGHNFSGTTAGESANHTHGGVLRFGGGQISLGGGGASLSYSSTDGQSSGHVHGYGGVTGGMNGNNQHNHSGSTQGMSGSGSHTHSGTCQASEATHNHVAGASTADNHTHSGTTDSVGKDGGWEPRYIDTILAAKSGPKEPEAA